MATERTTTARTARGEETRRALLDAAARLFAEHGYHATSVPDIVKAAGVGHGTFYEYFGSRHQILLALTQQAAASQQRRPMLTSPTLAERIRSEIFWYLSDHVEHLTLSKVWHEAASFDEEIAAAPTRRARSAGGAGAEGHRGDRTKARHRPRDRRDRTHRDARGVRAPVVRRRRRPGYERGRRGGRIRDARDDVARGNRCRRRQGGHMTDLFEIIEEDVRGVRLRVFKHAPPTLRAVWLASAAHGDNDYLVYEDERYTFADAHRIVASLARTLVSYGVQPGDRVAIAMRNYPEWAFAFWAAISVGATTVPLNAWWTGPELAYGLSDSGAVVLFADEERAERIAPHIGDTAVRNVVLARTDRYMPNAESFEDAVGELDSPPLPDVDLAPDDDASIMYTSGTTGRPKGAVATQRNFVAHLMNGMYRAAAAAAAAPPPAPGAPPPLPTATLLTFPLFHVGGLQSFLMPYTAAGGKIVLMYKWDAVEAVDLIERENVTAVAGVPTTVFQMLEVAKAQGRDLPSLAGVASGATLVPPELVRRIDDQFASTRGAHERIRPHRDLRRGDRQHGQGLRRPPGQRRHPDLAGDGGEDRRRGRQRGADVAMSARSGCEAPPSCAATSTTPRPRPLPSETAGS